jgi:hypothetical protein
MWVTNYQENELSSRKQCQLILNCVALSDISTADGLAITFNTYNGKVGPQTKDLGWPQLPPLLPRSHWQLWRQVLKQVLSSHPLI